MDTTHSALERLHELLNRAERDVLLLETALTQETEALSSRDVDALNQAVAQKLRWADSLEKIALEHTALLTEAGFSADPEGMQACLAAWDQDGALHSQWQTLQTVMVRCRHLNQVNGGVLQLQQQQVLQSIRLLYGDQNPQAPAELYDPFGRAVVDTAASHISSKA